MFTVRTKDGRLFLGKELHNVYDCRKDRESGFFITEFLFYFEPTDEFHYPDGGWFWVKSENFIPE